MKLSEMKVEKIPKKDTIQQIRTIIKKIEVSEEIKDIFQNIHENADKAWGFDNTTGKEKGKPKYKNVWRDWTRFKEWFEREILNQ